MTDTKTAHRVRPEDRARIRCQRAGCAAPADMCEHVHWDTGNTTGVSFFYFCDEHAPPSDRADSLIRRA